jgi:hypothetical protein
MGENMKYQADSFQSAIIKRMRSEGVPEISNLKDKYHIIYQRMDAKRRKNIKHPRHVPKSLTEVSSICHRCTIGSMTAY